MTIFPFMNYKLRKQLYDDILDDTVVWLAAEFHRNPPPEVSDPKNQTNVLVNFITLDLHALETPEGYMQMHRLLSGSETEQTAMLRLKSHVLDLRLTYGRRNIDRLIKETRKEMAYIYGLTVNLKKLDTNETLWLHPFLRKIYSIYGTGVSAMASRVASPPAQ